MLTKHQFIEEVPVQGRETAITISMCRKCYTAYLVGEETSVSQFGFLSDSQHDATKTTWWNVHKDVETYHNRR